MAASLAVIVLSFAVFFAGRMLERTQPRSSPAFHRLTYRLGVITGARFTPDGQSVLYSAAWDGKPV